MRKIYLLRGVPGSGKSSFIARHHLLPYAISRDAVLLLLSDLTIYYEEGKDSLHQVIPHTETKAATRLVDKFVLAKMQRGETVIVDGTHVTNEAVEHFHAWVRQYHYELFVVDLMKNADLKSLLKRNEIRMHYDWVKPHVIRTMYADYEKNKRVPSWAHVISPQGMRYSLAQREKDLAGFEHVFCIPDQVKPADFPHVNIKNFYLSFNDQFNAQFGSYSNVIELAKTKKEVVEDFRLPYFVFKFHHKHFLVSAKPIRNEMLDPIRKEKGIWYYSTGLYNVADFLTDLPESKQPHVRQFNLSKLAPDRNLHIW